MCTYVRMGKRVALTISTVGSKSIAVGDYVLVKHDDSEDATFDVAAQWKARVLEVRALGSEYKFIRVVWLNRPEDLEVGWKPFHGENELLPTNQMDVIDGSSVFPKLTAGLARFCSTRDAHLTLNINYSTNIYRNHLILIWHHLRKFLFQSVLLR